MPWTDDRNVLASVRPLRSLAQRIDLEARNGRFPRSLLSQWGPIKRRIDAIADRFQLPREVDPITPRDAPPRDAGAIASVEKAAMSIDEFLQQDASVAPSGAPGSGPLEADARRLQSRLYLLRQQLLGREAAGPIRQSVLDVMTARRQFEARAGLTGPARRKSWIGCSNLLIARPPRLVINT